MLRLFFVLGLFSCRRSLSAFQVALLDFGHARILATLRRGRVGARLYSAGNADRSLGLVMVVRAVAVAWRRSCHGSAYRRQ